MFTPPNYLSPSAIRTFQDCPQKFKFGRFDNIKEPPTWHTHLGNFVHEVLEHLYQLPHEERNIEAVRTLAGTLWTTNDWENRVVTLAEPLGSTKDFKVAAFKNMTNLWNLEDPAETDLDDMEMTVEAEVEGVRMKGIIDRVAIDDEQFAIISDYKTGKIPNPKFDTEDKTFFQLLAYALMLESSDGVPTSQLELLYLAHSTKLELEVTPVKLSIAKGTIVETKENLDKACETGEFVCNVTKLCDWCHYKKIGICPAHQS
jgi:putative RecB family exonuclease